MSGILLGTSDFVAKTSHLLSATPALPMPSGPSSRRTGLKTLLDASIPDAFHNSFARYSPAKCHPGTCYEYIDNILDWGVNDVKRRIDRILWMRGPAGVGKSAVAQTCAEALDPNRQLGATFFFSRPNSRDKPECFFTSIAFQLASKFENYGDIINDKLVRDPTLVTKSPRQQFKDLIVDVLAELDAWGITMDPWVIIVDGLDECADDEAQRDIIDIVATSVRDRTTPFLWAFFIRPEPHIVNTFTSTIISPLSPHMELLVSTDYDTEIAY